MGVPEDQALILGHRLAAVMVDIRTAASAYLVNGLARKWESDTPQGEVPDEEVEPTLTARDGNVDPQEHS